MQQPLQIRSVDAAGIRRRHMGQYEVHSFGDVVFAKSEFPQGARGVE
ncbi:hypothetical protein [Arthrobacter sp. LAR12-1-1.1]